MLQQRFTVYAIARRGRGKTDATIGHSLQDEAQDLIDLLHAIDRPVHLLGHSYGAHCALLAASQLKERVQTLVLYEPARAEIVPADALAALETLAAARAWDQLAYAFFANSLHVPTAELDALRVSEFWRPIVADAPASLSDLRALHAYQFTPARFAELDLPVVLQIGSESRRDLYVTDPLAAVLPHARIEILPGQAHEGMTTAPQLYVDVTVHALEDAVVPARR